MAHKNPAIYTKNTVSNKDHCTENSSHTMQEALALGQCGTRYGGEVYIQMDLLAKRVRTIRVKKKSHIPLNILFPLSNLHPPQKVE